jgi:site-specific DNA recombinase
VPEPNNVSVHTAKGRRYRYRYYTCFTRQRYGTEYCPADRLPADQLEHAVLDSLLTTLTRHDLIDAALTGAHAELDTQRHDYTDELASIDHELSKTDEAIERYLTAFEAGTMAEETCSPRVEKLAAKTTELRGRRDELTQLIDESTPPDKPSPDVLQALQDYVLNATDSDTPTTLRTLTQIFVHRVQITGRYKIKPTFKIPTSTDTLHAQTDTAPASPAEADTQVRTLPGSVHRSRQCTNLWVGFRSRVPLEGDEGSFDLVAEGSVICRPLARHDSRNTVHLRSINEID